MLLLTDKLCWQHMENGIFDKWYGHTDTEICLNLVKVMLVKVCEVSTHPNCLINTSD